MKYVASRCASGVFPGMNVGVCCYRTIYCQDFRGTYVLAIIRTSTIRIAFKYSLFYTIHQLEWAWLASRESPDVSKNYHLDRRIPAVPSAFSDLCHTLLDGSNHSLRLSAEYAYKIQYSLPPRSSFSHQRQYCTGRGTCNVFAHYNFGGGTKSNNIFSFMNLITVWAVARLEAATLSLPVRCFTKTKRYRFPATDTENGPAKSIGKASKILLWGTRMDVL